MGYIKSYNRRNATGITVRIEGTQIETIDTVLRDFRTSLSLAAPNNNLELSDWVQEAPDRHVKRFENELRAQRLPTRATRDDRGYAERRRRHLPSQEQASYQSQLKWHKMVEDEKTQKKNPEIWVLGSIRLVYKGQEADTSGGSGITPNLATYTAWINLVNNHKPEVLRDMLLAELNR